MKNKISTLFLLSLFASILISFQSCDGLLNKEDPEDNEESLYVKFINESASQYIIRTIEVRPRGPVGSTQTPTDNWSQNILTNGGNVAPGANVFFTLNIPSGHWYEYRLGVDDGFGNIVQIHNQDGFSGASDLPITHWGADTRTVSVTIVYNTDINKIVVTGYSDFAGID